MFLFNVLLNNLFSNTLSLNSDPKGSINIFYKFDSHLHTVLWFILSIQGSVRADNTWTCAHKKNVSLILWKSKSPNYN